MCLLHFSARRAGRVEDREQVVADLAKRRRFLDRFASRCDHLVEAIRVDLHAETREHAMVEFNVDPERLVGDVDEPFEHRDEEAMAAAEFLGLAARERQLVHLCDASDETCVLERHARLACAVGVGGLLLQVVRADLERPDLLPGGLARRDLGAVEPEVELRVERQRDAQDPLQAATLEAAASILQVAHQRRCPVRRRLRAEQGWRRLLVADGVDERFS